MAMKANELPLFFVLLVVARLFKLNLFGANILIL